MKKIFSLLLIATLLISLSAAPAAAEEVRMNVFSIETAYAYANIGLSSISAYIPEYAYDGCIDYNPNDASTFCDHKLIASQKDTLKGKAPLYDLSGNTGTPDAKYLCVLFFELFEAYDLDGFTFYCSDAPDGIPSIANVDGVDILLSETGLDGDWKLVYSGTELHCGKQYQVRDGAYGPIAYITADFESTKAQYIAFGLTQPRCQHKDALKAAYGFETADHPEYFRITELEFYGKPSNMPEIVTTPIEPAVTDNPTTALPIPATLNYEAILVTVLLLGMAVAALLVAKELKNTGKKQE